jgi:hypothetical protein
VIVEGTASTLTDAGRLAAIAPFYAHKYKSFTLDPKMGPIFEVMPKVVFGMCEARFKAATRWTLS